MGYTHYWTQTRSFPNDVWEETMQDIRDILSYVENEMGVPLGNAMGDKLSHPEFLDKRIMFNGSGEDAHETFEIRRRREKSWPGGKPGGDFCKTNDMTSIGK